MTDTRAAALARQIDRVKADPESSYFARAGARAAEAGKPASECEHATGSHGYNLWMVGYEAALITKTSQRPTGTMKTGLNEHQIEAIANADAHANNAVLPTYSELLNMLNTLSVEVLHASNLDQHDPLRTRADEAATMVCRAL
jgi:hypothetical protein